MPAHWQTGTPQDESAGCASGELERARKKPSNLKGSMPEAMPEQCPGIAGAMPEGCQSESESESESEERHG
jgi:hypothetical protein